MPVTLRIMSNVRAALEGDYKPSAIDKLLRFRPEGYQWSPSFKMGNWDGWVRLFNKGNEEFPAGCWPLVKDYFDVHHVKCEVRDFRSVPFHKGEFVVPRTLLDKKRGSIDLRPDQRKTIRLAVAATRGVVKSATGSGKCLGVGTKVLMLDGSVKNAEDVRTGDALLGPDSLPRHVLSTTKGRGPLYRITPVKGESWVCNDVHVLTLVDTVTGELVDEGLNSYFLRNKTWKHRKKLVRAGVEWPTKHLPVDPYFVGVWLGDGRHNLSQGVQVSKPDPQIRDVCLEQAKLWGLQLRCDHYGGCPTYRLVHRPHRANKLLYAMRLLKLDDYATGDRVQRSALLAGLLDTDGSKSQSCYDITQKDERIADLICFVSRSLGLAATKHDCTKSCQGGFTGTYFRVQISGDCTCLPLRIPRKLPSPRRQKKNVNRTGFSVRSIGVGNYYGFTLDGDGRFLLGDFTVTHNTEVMAGILTTLVRRTLTGLVPPKTLVIVPNRNLVNETSRRLEERLGITVGRISHGKWDERDITVALPATLGAKKYKSALAHLMLSLDVIMVDECHHSPSKSWYSVISKCQAYYRYGFSGTPLDRSDGSNLRLIAVTGPLIVDIESATLVAQGILAKPFVNIVEVTEPMLPDEGVPYSDVYALGIVKNINFHKAVVQQVIAERKKNHSVMVLVTQIDHGHYLDKRLWSMADFIPHRFIWAEMPNSEVEIEKAKKEFKSGLLPVLIASPIFGEGTDLPNVDTIIIADGGKSVIRVIQKVGRAMRKKATGPNRCKIIDFAHYTHPYLAKHSLKRINIYETEGFTFC